MFLKHYAGVSDKKLIEHLTVRTNGNSSAIFTYNAIVWEINQQ